MTSVSFNFTPPYAVNVFHNRKNMVKDNFLNNELETMPGFRLSWHYTGLGYNVTPESVNLEMPEESKLFIR